MTQNHLAKRFTLDEEAAKKIISSPRNKIRNVNVLNDIKLTKSERIAKAANILKSRISM